MKISPSILSADFTKLKEELKALEDAGADYVHVDVMDGRFVPNITIGPFIVDAIKRSTRLPLDVHLMIEEPERYIADFAKAGSDIITVHVEATRHLHKVVQSIKEQGKRAGVTMNPATPLSSIEEVMTDVDLILIMSVNPGFSGQGFIPSSLKKIASARKMIAASGRNIELEVDGGIKVSNIKEAAFAGADVFVSGSGVFGTPDYKKTIEAMRKEVA
ncbi:MAG: ribulose-phosphate 3-epimerase [Deltaproteobacteria bacterium GWB2_55_19]|nr:MAG: ribulose-phosphate 3-epimerase [Deltaproteobacteria bacterium GWB2_55_19]HAO92547.1 ribulose-phosphate 3-epimerase [Deltaproteobacteria bacterium]